MSARPRVRRLRPARLALAVLAAVAVLAGCATVPTGGPVVAGEAVPPQSGLDGPDIRLLAAGPRPGESPEQIVNGFLVAAADFDRDHAVAREYLTTAAGARWDSRAGVAVYSRDEGFSITAPSKPSGDETAVTVNAAEVATIDVSGGYQVSADGARLQDRYDLQRENGEWRIATLPTGLRLTRQDIARSYRAVSIYFLNRATTHVVPDEVFLAAERPSLPTAMVKALLAGPSAWLAPAVRTAVPPGTSLVGAVTVQDGVAAVDVSHQVLAADNAARAALSAQLVWTLKQLPEVTSVRLLAEGRPVDVLGVNEKQPRTAWQQFDPSGLPDKVTGYYIDGGRLRAVDGSQVSGPAGLGNPQLSDPAVSPNGSEIAGVVQQPGESSLVVSRTGGALTEVLSGADFTTPSFDADGNLWTAELHGDGTSTVWYVDAGKQPQQVTVPDLGGQPVTALRSSRDGTRVAMIIGAGPDAHVVVGRVVVAGGGVRIEALRAAAPNLTAASGLAWLDATRLAVIAQQGSNLPNLWVVEEDGSSVSAFAYPPLPTYDAIAAAPSQPLLVQSQGQIFQIENGGWITVGSGTDPAYPG